MEQVAKRRGIGALAVAVVAAVALVLSMGFATQTAQADLGTFKSAKLMNQFLKENNKYMDVGLGKTLVRMYSVKEQLKNARSSNTKVLQVRATKSKWEKGCWVLELKAKKPGKATISYTAKGKKYKLNCTVVKYSNPFAKLTIGGASIKAKFNKATNVKLKSIPAKKISLKLQPGWKLSYGDAECFYQDENGKTKYDYYTVKNGTVLKAGTTSISLELYNKKMGIERYLSIETF